MAAEAYKISSDHGFHNDDNLELADILLRVLDTAYRPHMHGKKC
jgi:hypothetical protein